MLDLSILNELQPTPVVQPKKYRVTRAKLARNREIIIPRTTLAASNNLEFIAKLSRLCNTHPEHCKRVEINNFLVTFENGSRRRYIFLSPSDLGASRKRSGFTR